MMNRIASSLGMMIACMSMQAQLTGTRTVGGANPDYATITAAVNALMNQGATGNVTFNIRPGTYSGQYSVGAVPGTPGTITFRNETNGAQDVGLEYDASGSSDNFIFRLDGSGSVVLEKLTFRPLDYDYARAVHFFNDITGLTIEQCVFHGSPNSSGSAYFERIIVYCDQYTINTDNNPQDVLILDNSFFNGNTAIELDAYGFSGARIGGLIISGNEFRQQVGTGIRLNNCTGSISDNDFSTTVGDWYVGIRTTFFDGGSQIRRNDIRAYATNGCTGIEVGNTQSTTGNMISNNMVYCSGTGDVWGMAVYNLWDMKIIHNSVLIEDGQGAQSIAFYHLSNFADGQDALVRNNIFANTTGGLAYKVNVAGNVLTEDHNCLFTAGSDISSQGASIYSTIAAHQAGTGQGTGDTAIDPVFPIQPDLHMNNCAMDNMGAYFFVVASDIDGDARGNPVCDMGADEFTASTNAMQAPPVFILASDLPYQLGLGATFNAYTWSTGATTPTTTITAGGNYSCNVLDANFCSYSINIIVVVDINTDITEVSDGGILLYPVPASYELNVTGLVAGAAFEVMDMQGRIVGAGTAQAITRIDVRELGVGLHLLRWLDGTTPRAERFIKQ